MSSEVSLEKATQDAVQRLGEMHSKLKFEELLAYATEVCLRNAPDYTSLENTPQTVDERIVSNLGLRGVRAAIEVAEGYVFLDNEDDVSPDEEPLPDAPEGKYYINLDSPVHHPRHWSTALDHEIITKTQKFGEALLTEAFTVLGTDVYQKIATLQSAETADEQMDVIEWMDARLTTLAHSGIAADDEITEEHFYHPVRLSPKMTGIYPDNALTPTCLAVSIIASSFFEQAGMSTLHVGVNESGNEKTIGTGIFLTGRALSIHKEKYGVELGAPSQTAALRVLAKLIETHKREDAQHAAVLVQLADNRWVQFDPNYQATRVIRDTPTNDHISKSYRLLHELKETAPGLELSSILPGDATASEILDTIFEHQLPEVIALIRERAAALLASGNDESLPQTIYNECFYPFFRYSHEDAYLTAFQDAALAANIRVVSVDMVEPELQNKFYDMFERYVLWGDSIETFQQKITTDPQYARNRVEDIVALPLMTAVAIAKSEAEDPTPWYTHHKLDIGLPATRIGFAALSDFAVYDSDSDLPDSFWMSHWPGNTAVIEHLSQESFSETDKNIVFDNVAYYDTHPFTSTKNHEIIKSFLDNNREESQDGETNEG